MFGVGISVKIVTAIHATTVERRLDSTSAFQNVHLYSRQHANVLQSPIEKAKVREAVIRVFQTNERTKRKREKTNKHCHIFERYDLQK